MSTKDEFIFHTLAVIAARGVLGLDGLAEDMENGPHIEHEGRSYYVHAWGCLPGNLGRAMKDHPDWYLLAVRIDGRRADVIGLPPWHEPVTLAQVKEMTDSLPPDEKRLAFEFTPAEKQRMYGMRLPEEQA
jgi:hypothetical protein